MALQHQQSHQSPPHLQQQLQQRRPPHVLALPPAGLTALQGVRVLANLQIIAFHVLMVLGGLHGKRIDVNGLFRDSTLAAAINNSGPFGVEVFFVMTGLLATLSLVRSLEALPPGTSTWRQALLPYYWRRVLRIYPAMLASAALKAKWLMPQTPRPPPTAAAADTVASPNLAGSASSDSSSSSVGSSIGIGSFEGMTLAAFYSPEACPWRLPAPLLGVSNMEPGGGCMAYQWSLSIQLQVYAILPLLLLALRPSRSGFRTRVALLGAAVVVVSAAARAWVALASGYTFPYMQLHSGGIPESATSALIAGQQFTKQVYLPTVMRMGTVGAGIILAAVLLGHSSSSGGRASPSPAAAACREEGDGGGSAPPSPAAACREGGGDGGNAPPSPEAACREEGGDGGEGCSLPPPLADGDATPPGAGGQRAWPEVALSLAAKVLVAAALCVHPFGPRTGGRFWGGRWAAALALQVFPFGPLTGCAIAVLLHQLVLPRSRTARTVSALLSSRPLCALGDLSYSAYLLHVPGMYLAARYALPWVRPAGEWAAQPGAVAASLLGDLAVCMVPSVAATYCLAWLQYRAVELPAVTAGKRLLASWRAKLQLKAA